MITLDSLRAYGADVETGLQRCVNNEAFYLQLVDVILKDTSIENLRAALDAKDLKQAFEVAHGMKGTIGNLSLDPLYNAVCDIVEPLRIEDADFDYDHQYQIILEQFEKLKNM